jgi:hypothetical protein
LKIIQYVVVKTMWDLDFDDGDCRPGKYSQEARMHPIMGYGTALCGCGEKRASGGSCEAMESIV